MKRYVEIMQEVMKIIMDQDELRQRPVASSKFRQVVDSAVTDLTPQYISLTCYYLNDKSIPIQHYWIPQRLTPSHNYPNTKCPLEHGELHDNMADFFDDYIDEMLGDFHIPPTNQNKCLISNMATMAQMTWYAWFKIQCMMDRFRVNYLGNIVKDNTLALSASLALNHIAMRYSDIYPIETGHKECHALLVFALFRKVLSPVMLDYLDLNSDYFNDILFPTPGIVGIKLID